MCSTCSTFYSFLVSVISPLVELFWYPFFSHLPSFLLSSNYIPILLLVVYSMAFFVGTNWLYQFILFLAIVSFRNVTFILSLCQSYFFCLSMNSENCLLRISSSLTRSFSYLILTLFMSHWCTIRITITL